MKSFIKTGVLEVDTLLGGGLPRGKLTKVLGKSNSGKTTLARYLALKACESGVKATEYSDSKPWARMEYLLTKGLVKESSLQNFFPNPAPVNGSHDTETFIDELLQREPAKSSDIILLDSVVFVAPGWAKLGLQEATENIQRILRSKARDTDKAILLVVQVNRETADRPDGYGPSGEEAISSGTAYSVDLFENSTMWIERKEDELRIHRRRHNQN